MHEEVQVWEPRWALSSCSLAATAAVLPSGIKAPQPRAENQHSGTKESSPGGINTGKSTQDTLEKDG